MVLRSSLLLGLVGCVAVAPVPVKLPVEAAGAPAWCGPGVAARVAGVPVDHATIQDAIDAAPSGAVVLICPGIYQGGMLRLVEDIELRGVTGRPDDVVLDGRYQNSLVLFAGAYFDRMVLRGLTITRGQDPVWGYPAVSISDGNVGTSTVIVDNCKFVDNVYDPNEGGNALSLNATHIGIRATEFSNNAAVNIDLSINDDGIVSIVDVVCDNVSSNQHYCVHIVNQAMRSQSQSWTFKNLRILDNELLDSVVSLTARGPIDLDLRIEDSLFARNVALENELVDVSATVGARLRFAMEGTVFEDNIAGDGSILEIGTGTTDEPGETKTFKDSVFRRNQANEYGVGPGLYPLLSVLNPQGYWNVDFGTGPDTNIALQELPACNQDVGLVPGPVWIGGFWCPP